MGARGDAKVYGPPGTRTQNHGINLPHRLSPASGAEAPALRSGPSLHPRPDRAGGRRMASEGSPADAGLPADRPIPGGFHRDGDSGALRGSQQIAADEPAISRLALLLLKSLALPIELTALRSGVYVEVGADSGRGL